MNDLILVYITNPTKKEAEKLAEHLLEKKMIACANIFPIESIYCWDSRFKKGKEFVLLLKTLADKFEIIKKEVKKVHPYSVPCILKIPVESNEEFFNWAKGEIK